MKVLVLLCAVGLAVGGHVGTVTTQYHAQDELGQYAYGYAGGPSAKHEERTLDGITRGGYSYLDSHGLVQSAAYVSDPHNGFRVAATNLPVGPAVPAGPAVGAVLAAPAVAAAPAVVAAHALAAAPAVVAARTVLAAPAVAPAVVAAPALSVAAAPSVLASGAVLAGGALSAGPIVAAAHGIPATSLSTVATAPGLTATRVITPVSDTVTVDNRHGLLHYRKRRSLVSPLALGLAGHGGILAHGGLPYLGALSNAPVETLAPTGGDTLAVSAARAAHAVAHAATSARDITNAHLVAPLGIPALAAAPLLAPGVPALAAGLPIVAPLSNHPVETLAPTGGNTLAVSAARAAHAAAHLAAAHRYHY